MSRAMTLAYGAVAYGIFFVTFCYAIGFVGNFVVPKSIDTGEPGPFWTSLAVNTALLGIFGLQHSVMARPGFKRAWTKIVPKPVERSTFVLFTCAALVAMYWQWRPMPDVLWSVENTAMATAILVLQGAGWLMVLLSTCMIHHFDLFGLRQTWMFAKGEKYRDLGFRTPGFYKYVRHPIMLGFLVAFWAAPVMTGGHMLFAAVTTAYIMVALHFEERDLVRHFGARYENYMRQVPKLIPVGASGKDASPSTSEVGA